MRYRVVEDYYGPGIRHRDWAVAEGTAESAGGALHLYGRPRARAIRSDYLYGGGGDVELTVRFSFDRLEDEGGLTVHFNDVPRVQASRGFRICVDRQQVRALLRDREVGACEPNDLSPDETHEARLVTLSEDYALYYDGHPVAEGRMAPPFVDNEGWTVLEASDADVRMTAFSERFVAHDLDVPAWERADLLYEESFTESSLRKNWMWDADGPEAGVTVEGTAFRFRHMANGFLRQRFDGPIVVDATAAPVPSENPKHTAGVTDAIFIWMIDHPEGDLEAFLADRTAKSDAGLPGLMPLPFYWVDFGGTNNVTTRMRKNPHRHMVRQFTDAGRLLARDRTYRINTVQNGSFVGFHVDGAPMIQAFDPDPITAGHVGFRAYVADLLVRDMKVWRIGRRDG